MGASQGVQVVKNPPANAGDVGLILGSATSPGGGHGKPTPVFLPGDSMDRETGRLQSITSQRVGHD